MAPVPAPRATVTVCSFGLMSGRCLHSLPSYPRLPPGRRLPLSITILPVGTWRRTGQGDGFAAGRGRGLGPGQMATARKQALSGVATSRPARHQTAEALQQLTLGQLMSSCLIGSPRTGSSNRFRSRIPGPKTVNRWLPNEAVLNLAKRAERSPPPRRRLRRGRPPPSSTGRRLREMRCRPRLSVESPALEPHGST